jgi:hypothetical protein
MHTIELTSDEMLALSSAICCKILQCERYAETVKSFIDRGADCYDNLERTETEIKRFKALWDKILKG